MKQANGKGYEAAVTMGGEGRLPCAGREEPGSSGSAARAEDLATALRRLGLDIDLLANDVSTSISRVNVRPRRVKTMLSKFVVMVAAGILASAVLGSSAKAFDEPIPTKISLLKWGGNPRSESCTRSCPVRALRSRFRQLVPAQTFRAGASW